MEHILPAMKAVHLFGLVFWMGGTMVQYLFLFDLNKQTSNYWLPINLHLLQKTFHWLITPGIMMFLLSGVLMIGLAGWNWFGPRVYLHIKISIFILLLIPVHLLWRQYKILKAQTASRTENDLSPSSFNHPVEKMKIILAIILIGLVINVLIGLYRFGF